MIGIIGGSGLYRLLDDAEDVEIDTPYGPPSSPISVGELSGRRVAFLPRHGREHQFPPHRVPYRANIWALREIGVRRVLAPCASGSLRRDTPPGTFVVCDQFVDRTSGRAHTFHDGPDTVHVSMADPFCAELRQTLVATGRALGLPTRERGTVVVIEGPRFSTRAESAWFASAGWDVVNMTAYPEAGLAREAGLCYANVSLVTDYDVGISGQDDATPVDADTVMQTFAGNLDRLRQLLAASVGRVGAQPDDACRRALERARV